ncbi:hypothetical protein [Methylocaldum szegediense]|jgi:hypothetical protein|uniref:Uncharacterized protein n=1 Tax=Methylocaldum szegediense TaxID=73780 RepID=A0ABN8X1Q9_9GAMM|nr:hypothetical protein [Methylocaldum szegediense]CAI8818200.1 protein of unknown function [Methylocaldum szegediense]
MAKEVIRALFGFLVLCATGLSLIPEIEERFWSLVERGINLLTN